MTRCGLVVFGGAQALGPYARLAVLTMDVSYSPAALLTVEVVASLAGIATDHQLRSEAPELESLGAAEALRKLRVEAEA